MERYDVYMYNVPKVGADDKPIPTDPHQTQDFSTLEEAQKAAAQDKDKFDRLMIIRTEDDKQKMVERYRDGEHEAFQEKEEESN